MLIQILVISGSALVVLGILLSALGRVNVRARRDATGTWRASSPLATAGIILVFVGVCAAVVGAVIANL